MRGENDLEEGRALLLERPAGACGDPGPAGCQRGELPADTDAHLLVEAITSPLLARVLLTGEPLEETLVPRLVDLVLDGARVRPPGRRQAVPLPAGEAGDRRASHPTRPPTSRQRR
ncbi:TetR-like C-terminal domain-containing protein [Streptomyces lasalocidi]